MKYPRVLTQTNLKCSERKYSPVFFMVPEGPPYVIECGNKGCKLGAGKFVRGATQDDAERLWLEKINRLPNSEE